MGRDIILGWARRKKGKNQTYRQKLSPFSVFETVKTTKNYFNQEQAKKFGCGYTRASKEDKEEKSQSVYLHNAEKENLVFHQFCSAPPKFHFVLR